MINHHSRAVFCCATALSVLHHNKNKNNAQHGARASANVEFEFEWVRKVSQPYSEAATWLYKSPRNGTAAGHLYQAHYIGGISTHQGRQEIAGPGREQEDRKRAERSAFRRKEGQVSELLRPLVRRADLCSDQAMIRENILIMLT